MNHQISLLKSKKLSNRLKGHERNLKKDQRSRLITTSPLSLTRIGSWLRVMTAQNRVQKMTQFGLPLPSSRLSSLVPRVTTQWAWSARKNSWRRAIAASLQLNPVITRNIPIKSGRKSSICIPLQLRVIVLTLPSLTSASRRVSRKVFGADGHLFTTSQSKMWCMTM